MKFPKKILQDLAYTDHDVTAFEIIKDEVCTHSRWSVGHSLIFKDLATNKFYSTYYSVGATEQQCEDAYEYSKAEVECDEVEPKKVQVIQYVKVKSTTEQGVQAVE